MNTKKPRSTGDLGIGQAIDKIIAIRRGLAPAVAKAHSEVVARFGFREAAVLRRVPRDLHGALARALEALTEDDGPIPEMEAAEAFDHSMSVNKGRG